MLIAVVPEPLCGRTREPSEARERDHNLPGKCRRAVMDGRAARHGGKAALPPRNLPPLAAPPQFALGSSSCWRQLCHPKAFEENCSWSSADNCFVSDSLTNWEKEEEKNNHPSGSNEGEGLRSSAEGPEVPGQAFPQRGLAQPGS